MSTVSKAIGDVQRKLDFPVTPDVGIIAEFLIETDDEKVTEANLTSEAWFIAKARIDVDAGRSEYPLDSLAPGFDKARYLYTADESDPTFRRRPVQIVPIDSLTEYYDGGDSIGAEIPSTSAKHSAIAAAVYYDVNRAGTFLEIAPIPNQTAQYVLSYEVSVLRPQTAQDVNFRFPQFDNYISDCTALRLISLARWAGFSDEQNMERRRELAGSLNQGYGLVADVARGDKLYWKWKWSMKNASGITSIGWARNRW